MGVDTRRHVLPAPTESIVDTTGGSTTATDIATDVSRRTDKTSYSIPDDGSPITISTRRRSQHHRDESSKLSRTSHQSQTSLLIEYFEGGKGSGNLNSRPSIRVKVTPSAARKLKDGNDHIQITESGRKPIYTRRISLTTPSKQKQQLPDSGGDDASTSSYNSAAEDNNPTPRRPPLEIEFVDRDQKSEHDTYSRDSRHLPAPSDISTMPPDSILDEPLTSGPRRKRSQSLGREEEHERNDLLKAPSRRRSRSLSRERIAHKVAEKLSSTPRDISNSKHRHGSHSASRDYLEEDTAKSPRRHSHRYREEDIPPSAESSLLSSSASRRRSGDRHSFQSGTSRSSLNNPKLLETVEDAIRRLILPELKELKKDQKIAANTSRFDSEASESRGSTSKDESGRRPSKHSSAPEVTKPTVVLNKDSKDEGIVLSEESPVGRKENRRQKDAESPPENVYVRGARPELREDERLRRQRSRGLRDAEAAGIVGNALTAAALRHHDSRSDLDRRERRKRRSRSRAGSVHLTETELVFQKHNVPPMPLRSDIDSEVTRDSILSQRTEETVGPRQVRDVSRGSPRENGSAGSNTPTRNAFGTHHSNLSTHDVSVHGNSPRDLRKKSHSPTAKLFLSDDHSDHDDTEREYDERTKQRALSPIQSVASDHTEVHVEHDKARDAPHSDSEVGLKPEPRLSIDSLSSPPSTYLAKSRRQQALLDREKSKQNGGGAELGYEESRNPSKEEEENWEKESGESEPEEDDGGRRRSTAEASSDDPRIDAKRMTNYTDDSLDAPYLDKVTSGQQVADGHGANPEYVHTPVAVESAVASLLESSVVDNAFPSANHSRPDSRGRPASPRSSIQGTPRGFHGSDRGSPLKYRQDASSPDETSCPRRMGATSPPQSVSQSVEDEEEKDEPPHMGATALPGAGSPMPEAEHVADSESEINTNPSIIQGPIGGISHENRDHWPYNPTPPRTKDVEMPSGQNGEQGPMAPGAGMTAGYDQPYYQPNYGNSYNFDNYGQPRDGYMAEHMILTPPGAKDEGYISAANARSPSIASPDPQNKVFGGGDSGYGGLFGSADDSFGQRHFSGYSQGIPSPLYDGATGGGIDRIQSKDIIALMEHLTVRDAQRNARDTEILVTLVRSAAEMRNSFEEMKKFIAQQDELLMEASEKQAERIHKVIGGPRPQPPSGYRSRQQQQQQQADDNEDLRSKRRNVFKRALKGLSLKSSNDLSKIEEMLEQLLEEVEALRAAQEGRRPGAAGAQPDGYEPEGQAGTSSNGDQSGYLSNSSRTAPDSQGAGARRGPEGRPSTVLEEDEGMDGPEQDQMMARDERGDSVQLETPPRAQGATGPYSNGTTPQASTEKSRKSFFPKFTRWSKTTASSTGENTRNTVLPGRKERPFSEASRSGSDLLAHGPYDTAKYYDPQGDDRLRSTYTLDEQLQQRQENRPPSPLVPSQVSEKPKYQAHRDSLDLKHPQPRQGPTDRYQTQLESQAQNFVSPITPSSDPWGSSSSLQPTATGNTNRYSAPGRLSPISDAGYSDTSSAPPRPPKIMDDGPLVPQRPLKTNEGEQPPSYLERMTSRSSAVRSSPPQRRPTGPRPLTSSSSQHSPANPRRHRFRDSPVQVDDEAN
ncbi:hypothetical protein M432DRAFT_634109 [Thermoascus aurantiacus ATCC 26904]